MAQALKKAASKGKEKEKPHYLKRRFNSIVGEKSNNEALSFIMAAVLFAVLASFFEDPLARRRHTPEYRILNNHLYDMQTDFGTALIVHLRKKHQYGAGSRGRGRSQSTLEEYNQGVVDKLFNEEFLSQHGLDDVIVGGKAQMLHSEKQFILIKLPLDLAIPNLAEPVESDSGEKGKTKEQ